MIAAKNIKLACALPLVAVALVASAFAGVHAAESLLAVEQAPAHNFFSCLAEKEKALGDGHSCLHWLKVEAVKG